MRIVDFDLPFNASGANDWLPAYPNPADFRFNYYKLLKLAQTNNNAIGKAPPGIWVAVIGAGVAGMTAARELFRCGYNVVIYEASDRICGRHYTVPIPGQITAMELGAMRFPYFGAPGSQNCVFDYYLTAEANAATAPFPNPGAAPGNTGIYMNQGYGPNGEFYPTRRMMLWPASNNSYNPPNDAYLRNVYDLETAFIDFFSAHLKTLYLRADWPAIWTQIANHYDKMTFSDLVFTPATKTYANDGWFGGFGMNDAQSELFYTIGAGDGSWGAFYEIAAMWFIRCVMFGFNSNLQSMLGILNKNDLPYYNDSFLHDTNGHHLAAPLYEGIQTLPEWLFYQAAPGSSSSLFDAMNDNAGVKLYLNTGVVQVANDGVSDGTLLTVRDEHGYATAFNYVIVTPTLWASQMSLQLSGFNPNDVPLATLSARDQQHNIASCKVFFPLVANYWNGTGIPQDIITDTFLQDAYGIQWRPSDPGALLASYTWEDDALKLLPYNDAQLAERVLGELDNILTSTVGKSIRPYVNANDAVVFQWSLQPTYHGCAKLYRQRNWTQDYSLLAYNQQHSAGSRLYFAGENYSVEGGWTEPALRLALDAVIRLIKNSGGTFNNGFSFNDYPRFDTVFTPDYEYPVCNDA